ncbi:MAG: hypothetical protein ACOCX2_03820 [Armatimonadota bacterium]
MARRLSTRTFAPWLIALLIWVVARIACVVYVEEDADERTTAATKVTVNEHSETLMQPLDVVPPQQQRWRDIGGVAYDRGLREEFDYAHTGRHRAEVFYDEEAATVRGTVRARTLKPNFAYQLKLVGLAPLRGVTEAANAANARAWSSWQLGRLGRWWCEDCQWNVLDADLATHVEDGHEVTGYLLFDWLVTDEKGDADHRFSLDSSLHVLWRVGQRERGPKDSPPRWYSISRPGGVYPRSVAEAKQQLGIFAEWEPDRPEIGEARLAPGGYHVGMNLTEESFHDNLGDDRTLEGGGCWAWVLQSELQFQVRDVQ